ncbi:transcription-repair coupling factor (superfamily II helicase) [Dehalogenimonas formicexedens]|uniref:Transcription-repair-coupling factor n=1 Tax=Dehalogenimonas formicexedens TaxID=1839801 RepID=A0A1P8F869_9CHLR|nr:transcription-repair coupling factor [Dehalogenimonas formicexedens]APV44671.1 transcription-repair coupling factor (superfamily II helicase) [Dehalogenimonas formicexedens]
MTELHGLFDLLSEEPHYKEWLAAAKKPARTSSRISVIEAARPYLTGSLFRDLKRPILVITSQAEKARDLTEQIALWLGDLEVQLFPQPELLPYQRAAVDRATELETVSALSSLAGLPQKKPLVTVISLDALARWAPKPDSFRNGWLHLTAGAEYPPLELVAALDKLGYQSEHLVEAPGTYSRRGGIVDIFPPTEDSPIRLEYFGDTIESLRTFDPATQRSSKRLESAVVGPATLLLDIGQIPDIDLGGASEEMRPVFTEELEQLKRGSRPETAAFWAPYTNSSTILNYLSDNTLVIVDEPDSVEQAAQFFRDEAECLRAEKTSAGELPNRYPQPYIEWATLKKSLAHFQSVELASWGTGAGGVVELPISPSPSYAGRLPAFFKKAQELKNQGARLIVVSYQSDRLKELFSEEHVDFSFAEGLGKPPAKSAITLLHGLLGHGWTLSGETYLFTDNELFGFVKERRWTTRRLASSKRLMLPELEPGDYVVHVDHGVARFAGTVTMEVSGARREYLQLEYAGEDKLYVPTDQVDRVSRYIGGEGEAPTLNKLGTQEWARSKERAQEAAREVAAELIELYAARQIVPGYAYSRDTLWQQELEGSFPYVETPDQASALSDVKEDMEKPRPMDRLILGDVGYGKTEVALRAAFKAVMDGKQVAVLVPTTVLAQQHYSTFRARLAAFPVKIEVISRFRSDREQTAILDALEKGEIDIIIGTHRLLQPDVRFKKLGMLIIDEEQRFGVMHKEFLKRMRQEVDVLTLSATPIPRTLHLSLVGVRDMSVIETPPNERLPIKTFVAGYDDHLVREAILREKERNGQVFFVHNRVQSIYFIAERLRKLVPEASFIVGHGQMPEGELEAAMAQFAAGEVDVLVCTTIIESGLDVPNANTLIVNQADKFGLTQLYQLRGRVGRGANLAYAYFLYEKGKRLTGDAEKRLRTIFEASELGAGYGIAMKDLEIRGAGSLLGTRQSGHISAIGFNLYTQMLSEAVEEQKTKRSGKEVELLKSSKIPPPTIELPLTAFIPESYIPEESLRLELYQRLAAIKSEKEIADFERELVDRFGQTPVEAQNLSYIIRLRLMGLKAGIKAIGMESGLIAITFLPGIVTDLKKISPLKDGLRASTNKVWIDYLRLGSRWRELVEETVWRLGK